MESRGRGCKCASGSPGDNEGLDIHYLFTDLEIALAGQHSGMVDGLGQAKLEDLSEKSLIFRSRM